MRSDVAPREVLMNERRGDPIQGSRYVRDFCAGCAAPIRVAGDDLRHRNWCLECQPHQKIVERSGRDGASADREYHGGRFTRGEW